MAVAFDAVGPNSAGTATAATTSISWSHTCSGGNRLLTVSVSVGYQSPSTTTTTTATYNGVAMVSAAKVNSNNQDLGYVEMFYTVAPPTGSHTVVVTANNTSDLIGGSVSFTGVDQTNPLSGIITTFGNSTTPSVTVTSKAGDMVVDGVCTGTNITAAAATQRWGNNLNNTSAASNGSQSTSAGATSVTDSYTIAASDWWGAIGMNVVAATRPSFVAVTNGVYGSTTTPQTLSVTSQVGDLIVVYGATQNTSSLLNTPSGNSIAFTLTQSLVTSGYAPIYIWTGVDNTGGTWNLSVSATGGGQWGASCLVFRTAGVGTSGVSNNTTAGGGSLTLTPTVDNSIIVAFTDDSNAVDGSSRTWRTANGVTPTAGNGLETTYNFSSGAYTVYGAYYNDAGDTTSKIVGISAPSGQKWAIVGLEIKASVLVTNVASAAWLTA